MSKVNQNRKVVDELVKEAKGSSVFSFGRGCTCSWETHQKESGHCKSLKPSQFLAAQPKEHKSRIYRSLRCWRLGGFGQQIRNY